MAGPGLIRAVLLQGLQALAPNAQESAWHTTGWASNLHRTLNTAQIIRATSVRRSPKGRRPAGRGVRAPEPLGDGYLRQVPETFPVSLSRETGITLSPASDARSEPGPGRQRSWKKLEGPRRWVQGRTAREGLRVFTFAQLAVPHRDDGSRVLAVVDEPQRQGLHALLRVAQLRELLLQRGFREGGHGGGGGEARQGAAWAAQCGGRSDGRRPGPHQTARETLYSLTGSQAGKGGGGWVSAVTAAGAAATRWPPTSHPAVGAGSKGKGRRSWTPGGLGAVDTLLQRRRRPL